MAGLSQAQLFVGHQTSSQTSSASAASRGPRDRVNQTSSGNFRDMRILCKLGQPKEALHILNQQGSRVGSMTYVHVLQECIDMKGLAEGRQVHDHIIQTGFKPNIFLLNTLMNMYAKCGSVEDSRQVFDKMPERNVFTWTIMIAAYAKHGFGREALEIYEQMIHEGETPDKVTFICVLNACASLGALEKGKEVHANIIKAGVAPDIILETALVDLYAKCGSMMDAHEVFDKMTTRDVVSWNAMVAGYVQHGCCREAFQIYEVMELKGVPPNKVTFICILKACASLGALGKGKEVHADIIKSGIVSYINLENTLIDMYAKCESMKDAHQVFDNMAKRNVVSWNAMLAGYAQHGCGREALQIYEQMQQEQVPPDRVTFICVLNACASLGVLEKGQEVHAEIIKSGTVLHINVGNTLVDMYAKCGSMKNAYQVFNNMAQRNVVSWNTMITGYAQHGCGKEALETYDQMQQDGVTPDRVTFICVLNACASLGALKKGKEVHADIMKAGIAPYVNLENTLVDMYAKCRSMKDACQVFDNIAHRNEISFNTMISGYTQLGFDKEALSIYEQMRSDQVTPNRVTYLCVLNVCANLGALDQGKEVHADIIKAGIVSYVNLENTLVNMYAKCGSMEDSRQVFDNMAERNIVSWSTIITGYAQHGHSEEAFEMYKQLMQEGVMPDSIVFTCALNVCASSGALEKGKEVHGDIVKAGIAQDIVLETALVDMYAKCGSIKDARQVFDTMTKRDVVSFCTMITGYAHHGCDREAFTMYEQMIREGVTPDKVTFICILNVCARLGVLEKGKDVHADIIKVGTAPDTILETALADMYANCGSVKDAHEVFDNMAEPDVVSWNVMMAGYAQHGCGREALEMYEQMIHVGMTPDKVTFICVLNVCASLGALEKGKEVHADIIKSGEPSYINLENTFVDMYAKCGSVKDARQVFDSMTERNVVSWNAMIAGYGQHGCAREALQIFDQMQQEGFKPDGITFVSLLCACSYVGLVNEGYHYFACMSQDYGLSPTVEHFGCMVDLLGRGGRLNEAEDFINKMPMEADASVWGALLGACRVHGNVELAERAAKSLLKGDSQDAATYKPLSNIYVATGVGR